MLLTRHFSCFRPRPPLTEESDISPSPPIRERQSYRHEAFLWRRPADFVAGLVPFIKDGLADGEPVMVALIEPHADWLRAGLGTEADRVTFVDMAELGRNPGRIIPAWQHFLDAQSGRRRPVRGIGEPIWAGRRTEEILECQLHEAMLNIAVDPETPFWLICPYDARRLPSGVIEEAHRSHPAIIDSQHCSGSSSYSGSSHYGGRAHLDAMFGAPLSPPARNNHETTFGPHSLNRVFTFVALHAHAAGLAAGRSSDLATAVQRLAAGSLHRGAEGGTVRVWAQPHGVTAEVVDPTVVHDLLAGRRAPLPADRDGLWFVNQHCDLVQLRSSDGGTTVRLHAWT